MSGARPEDKKPAVALVKAAFRIPAEILQIPLDALLFGLNRFAEKANDSIAGLRAELVPQDSRPPQAPSAETAVVVEPEVVVSGLNRTLRPDLDCLRGDDLKLVRSRILFVKRGYEFAFPAQEDLIADDLEVGVFEAWKVAEFVQRMADPENAPAIPAGWAEYPPGGCRHANGRLRRFPTGDSKYLRVFFEVLNYYRREDLRYHENQLRLLREIGEALGRPGEFSHGEDSR